VNPDILAHRPSPVTLDIAPPHRNTGSMVRRSIRLKCARTARGSVGRPAFRLAHPAPRGIPCKDTARRSPAPRRPCSRRGACFARVARTSAFTIGRPTPAQPAWRRRSPCSTTGPDLSYRPIAATSRRRAGATALQGTASAQLSVSALSRWTTTRSVLCGGDDSARARESGSRRVAAAARVRSRRRSLAQARRRASRGPCGDAVFAIPRLATPVRQRHAAAYVADRIPSSRRRHCSRELRDGMNGESDRTTDASFPRRAGVLAPASRCACGGESG
jgi:hypothetical protein